MQAPERWGLAAFLGGPACVSLSRPGVLEWVVVRRAPYERAFGVLPLPAHPASGIGTGEGGLDYGVWVTGPGDYRTLRLPQHARRTLRNTLFEPSLASLDAAVSAPVTVDREDVVVSALKPAGRKDGFVVRLRSYAPGTEQPVVTVDCPTRTIRGAHLCDARERDLAPLAVDARGRVDVPLGGSITSVRLRF
jgi:hypothetical protein